MGTRELRYRIDGQTPLRRSTLLTKLAARLPRSPGRVRHRANDGVYSDPDTRPGTLRWVQGQLRNAGPDKRLYLQPDHGPRIVVDVVEIAPVGDPNFDISAGDPAIERIVTAAAAEFPKLLSLGGLVCKWIAGTTTPSQHCKFGPLREGCNAWDLALKKNGVYSTRLMWQLAHWLVNNADHLGIAVVIFRDRIWTPEGGWHSYSGVFHAAHVHVNPKERYDLACRPS